MFRFKETAFIIMKKALFVFLAAILFSQPVQLLAQESDREIDAVLTAAEGLFKAMQGKDCAGIWTHLSGKSRQTIVTDTFKAMKSASCTEASIADDFARGGKLSRDYWDAYLKYFDPAMALEESRWEMGPIKGDHAEITLSHKKNRKPATVYMTREDGAWRVGLVESFWSRK